MRLASCVAMLAVVLATGCRSAGLAECTDNGECPSDQVCNRHTRLCYKPDPVFSVQITSPEDNAAIQRNSFRLAGSILNAPDAGLAAVQYQIGDGGWISVQPTSSGHFETYPPLPTANGDPLNVSVVAVANDDAQSRTESSVSILVDNIGPVATLTAADGERAHPLNIAVQFSEPVLLSDPDAGTPLVLTPPDGVGTWNSTRTEYRITDLQPDTVYAAEVKPNAVQDQANNPSAETHATFRTAAVQPSPAFVLNVPSGIFFDAIDAKADTDGVVTLAAHASAGGAGQVIWGWFDPRTGGFVTHTVTAPTFTSLEVGASVGDALDSARIHTLTIHGLSNSGTGTDVFSATSADPADAGVHVLVDKADAIIPGPPGCGESGNPDDLGIVQPGDAGTLVYMRDGSGIPLPFLPDLVAYAGPSDWSLASVADGGLTLAQVNYDCASSAAPSSATQIPIPITGIVPGSLTGVAVPEQQFFAFLAGGAPKATCAPCTGPDRCVSLDSLPGLRVGALSDGGTILGAWRDQVSGVTLGTADLALHCPGLAGDWSNRNTLPISASQFQPVQFGRTPGLVYIDGARTHVAIAQAAP